MRGCSQMIPGEWLVPSLPAPVLSVQRAGAQGIPNFCLVYIYKKAHQCGPGESLWPLLCLVAGNLAASLLMSGSSWGTATTSIQGPGTASA